jgi:hypothetical protein
MKYDSKDNKNQRRRIMMSIWEVLENEFQNFGQKRTNQNNDKNGQRNEKRGRFTMTDIETNVDGKKKHKFHQLLTVLFLANEQSRAIRTNKQQQQKTKKKHANHGDNQRTGERFRR